ncbi:MAG: 2-phospho-L-lactate transferase [Gammaproteobacteria bacterium]|nr:2-phospho-L-lactate transferase [Gammaproteobacteria bacterium]
MSGFAGHVLALAGGVGGAKLIRGLALQLAPAQLTAAVNTADDFNYLGLDICPDLDSVTYALAGLNDEKRGWGLRDETWRFMAAVERLGGESWFSLGDQDLATHVLRTARLREGASLTEVTGELTRALGISVCVAPMCDQPVRTLVDTGEGQLAFQHYFVARRCEPVVQAFHYRGAQAAQVSTPLADALVRPDLAVVVICPSNPFISIDPMLALPGLRARLEHLPVPVIAVSPIVGGDAIKGPAAKMLRELGLPVSAAGIAQHYGPLLDGYVIDRSDARLAGSLAPLPVHATNTLMRNDGDRADLAGAVLRFAEHVI